MDTLTSLLPWLVAAIWLVATVIFYNKMRTAQDDATQARSELYDQTTTATAASLEEARKAAAAEAKFTEARARLDVLEAERNIATERATKAERDAALAQQSVAEMQARIADWETVKQQGQEAAKAAVLETATAVSTKLLEDHKRETEAAKKESEEKVQQAKEEFAKHVNMIAGSVSTLNTLVNESRATIDTVVRALSTPGGAGQSAEIGLENTLKSFGLERNRDFMIQHSVTEGESNRKLRPDAIVFLPSESVLVVDSKASKFVLEIAQTEGTEDEPAAYARLGSSMNTHLRSLADKDYRNAILDAYRRAGRQGDIRRIISVMYVPQDGALERLKRADPDFARKAAEFQIIPVGPAGLACMIGFARVDIDTGRQIENQEKIVVASQKLLDGITMTLGHAASVGTSIKNAAEHFANFAKSVNRTLLPRARALPPLGVRPEKKTLPANLSVVQVVGLDGHTTINGEANEDELLALTSPAEDKADSAAALAPPKV